MEPRDHLQVVRNGWRAVTLAALVGVGLAAVLTIVSTRVYLARAEVLVSTSANDATSSAAASVLDRERAATYARLFDSPTMLAPVVERLGLAASPAQLAAHVGARVLPDTALIEVTVVDASPEGAQTVARAIAELLPAQIEQLERVDPAAPSPVRLSVAREAEAAQDAVSPRPVANIGLGLALGLVVGLGWVLLRHVLEPRVTSARDVHEVTQESVDAQIGRLPVPVEDADLGEGLRALCLRVGLVDDDAGPRTVAVTSSVAGEGASTVTRLLARRLADAGLRVVVVEAGTGTPGVQDAPARAGLTDLLVGRTALEDVLVRSEAPFDVLPHGRVPTTARDLLGTSAMEALLDELAGRFDRVLVDAPPVTAGPDTPDLARVVDGVLFVVGAGAVTRDTLRRALGAVEPPRVIGFVLNGVAAQDPAAATRVARRSARGSGPRAGAVAAALRERLRAPAHPRGEGSPDLPTSGAPAASHVAQTAVVDRDDAARTAQPLPGAHGADAGPVVEPHVEPHVEPIDAPLVEAVAAQVEEPHEDASDRPVTRIR